MTADYDVCDQNLFPSQTVPGTAENFAKTSHESSNRLGNHFGQAVKRLESKKARNPDLIVRSPTTPVWHLGKVSINVRARSRDPNMTRRTGGDESSRPTSISRRNRISTPPSNFGTNRQNRVDFPFRVVSYIQSNLVIMNLMDFTL